MLLKCFLLAFFFTNDDAAWGVMLTHNFQWIMLGYLIGTIVQKFIFWLVRLPPAWKRRLSGLRGLYIGMWAPLVSERFETVPYQRAIIMFILLTLYTNRREFFSNKTNQEPHIDDLKSEEDDLDEYSVSSSDDEHWNENYTSSSNEE